MHVDNEHSSLFWRGINDEEKGFKTSTTDGRKISVIVHQEGLNIFAFL
jgi:hypothetical protein